MKLQDYQILNRRNWQDLADDYIEPAEKAWRSSNEYWGIWNTSEQDLQLLPEDLKGKKCIELGCGGGYVSAWLARRGAKAVGIDPTPNQLKTARRLETKYRLGIEFVEGFCEHLPFSDSSFDFAISEYGASVWADPYKWIPEAARVLNEGSQLIFMTDHPFSICCVPDDGNWNAPMSNKLLRPYIGIFKHQWKNLPCGVEFHLTHGEWFKLLLENNFVVERLLEVGAKPESKSRYAWADSEWARKWPAEEVWCVRLSS